MRGATELKEHPFFSGVNWEGLRKIRAPFEPKLSSAVDTQYFPIDEIPQVDTSSQMRAATEALMASSARIDELKQKFDENPRRYFAPLANEFRKVGDLEQAILICEAYLPQQPGHMSGHIVYGQALFESGRL